MDVTALTQLSIAVGYGIAAVFTFKVWRRYTTTYGGTHAIFATAIAVAWGTWYLALAFLDPGRDPWSALNRALHIPVIAFLILVSYSRLYDDGR